MNIASVLAGLACLPVLALAATPTITSVSGTAQTGQILTITGTSMVQEDRTNWDPWFKITHPNASGMEGASPAADGYDTAYSPPNLEYVSNVKLLGSKSMHLHDQGTYSWPTGTGRPYMVWPQGAGNQSGLPKDVYFRMYTRWNWNEWPRNGGSQNNSELKYWWQGSDSHPDAENAIFWNFQPNNGSAPAQFGYEASGDSGGYRLMANIPSGPIQNNRWYCIETHAMLDQGGVNAPYVLEAWIDGTQIINHSASAGIRTTSAGWAMHVNYWAMTSAFVGDTWDDGMALSSTRVRPASVIEIGNSSDYATAAKVYQPPEFLSDTSSQFKANLAGLGAGPYFLWVTNNRGERSAAISLVSGGPIPLSPPPNLR